MAEIDLDLVELRCKLRGWKCERARRRPRLSDYIIAHDPRLTRVINDDDLALSYDVLTRPRRTLADVVANPPEGWVAYWGFGWSSRPGELHAVADVDDAGKLIESPHYREPLTLAEMSAAHRAVADLLDLLAEVSG